MLFPRGSNGAVVNIYDAAVYSISPFGGGGTTATIRFKSNGTWEEDTSGGGTLSYGDWVTPTSAASDFEIRATVVSGTVIGSATGSWLALSSDRSWSRRAIGGFQEATITVEIRRASDSVVVDSADIYLYAEVFEDKKNLFKAVR
jgi:hypothetical protein